MIGSGPWRSGRGGRAAPTRRWPLFCAPALLLVLSMVALSHVACEQGDAFQCGTLVPGSEDAYRRCDAPHQVCVCATNSCAVRDRSCDAGLRYLDNVFARTALRGDCVDPADTDADAGADLLAEDAGNTACLSGGAVLGRSGAGGAGGGGANGGGAGGAMEGGT